MSTWMLLPMKLQAVACSSWVTSYIPRAFRLWAFQTQDGLWEHSRLHLQQLYNGDHWQTTTAEQKELESRRKKGMSTNGDKLVYKPVSVTLLWVSDAASVNLSCIDHYTHSIDAEGNWMSKSHCQTLAHSMWGLTWHLHEEIVKFNQDSTRGASNTTTAMTGQIKRTNGNVLKKPDTLARAISFN